MFGIPEKYKKFQLFSVSSMIPKDLKLAERKKMKEAIQKVELVAQVENEIIPSLINETHNCQVIVFLNIRLKSLKEATFVSNMLQQKMKPFCVIRLYDSTNELYSFAHKRVSKVEEAGIVVENVFLTKIMPIFINDEQKRLMEQFSYFDAIINKTTKYVFYLEMSIKTYIISHLKVFSKTRQLLESNIWFNEDDMIMAYETIMQMDRLRTQLLKADRAVDKVKINGELKKLIHVLNEKLED
ncbi:DUF4391 domain-containing protein [Peribacillus sp. NPDC096622]|uniref:DUF4391 domain-containing protein n=1 Tax=Peribacillus sp. NPDC096622 TaxID=3364396 RepID=UPI00380391AC